MTQVSAIVDRYLARTPKSAERNAEAAKSMPGGDTRSTAWFQPYPPFVAEGHGAAFTDIDGNRYIELLNNYTSLIHGHAHPAVVEAIQQQLGLKLEAEKTPVDVLAIDHVEKPSPN